MEIIKKATTNFVGNHKAEDYRDKVTDIVQSCKAMWCNMSVNVHFLNSHFDLFPEKSWGSEHKHGERFHRDISIIKKNRYQSDRSPSVVTDYCWTLRTDVPQRTFSRKSPTVTFSFTYTLSVA
jgi:hypothetical protein